MPCNAPPTSKSQGSSIEDIEEVVPLDPERWRGHKPRQPDESFFPYVLLLNEELEKIRDGISSKTVSGGESSSASSYARPLTSREFSMATSRTQKVFRENISRGKSKLVHVYRELVRQGKIVHDQNIENLMVKKLSKSLFGGINLSIFIPPGHTAPFWNVKVTCEDDTRVRITVTEKKSVYTLKSYASYVNVKRGAQLSIGGQYTVIELHDNWMIVESIPTPSRGAEAKVREKISSSIGGKTDREDQKNVEVKIHKRKGGLPVHVWDLVGDIDLPALIQEFATGASKDADTLQLKGAMPIKTCTFGCVYCPTETSDDGEQANPKSYLTHEPGVLRAVRNGYSTTSQVYDRVISLRDMGHNVSKVFVRCVGGTWSVVTKSGQRTFIRDIFYALNTIDAPLSREPLSLEEEQRINETGNVSRAVEICVEDHPKMINSKSLRWARDLGVTAIEMGVQTTNDEIHRLTKRDSTREELIDRAHLAKEFGFKTLAHIMPDLPGSSPDIDRQTIDDIVNGKERLRVRDLTWVPRTMPVVVGAVAIACAMNFEGFGVPSLGVDGVLPDKTVVCLCIMLVTMSSWALGRWIDQTFGFREYYLFDYDRYKLYPTMVLEYSELKEWYKSGKYVPYWQSLGPDALYNVIQYFLEAVKPYQRVERVIRDMPAGRQKGKVNYVVGGVDVTNAQQIVLQRMKEQGKSCVCLRTREIRNHPDNPKDAVLFITHYYANRGEEFFISFETPSRERVFGFLKLRFNNGPGRERLQDKLPPEIRGKSVAIIRWLQVYGRAIAVGGGSKARSSQHVGFGRRLMEKAEEIARKHNATKIADISGVGVREYYRKLGYELEGTYMCKRLW